MRKIRGGRGILEVDTVDVADAVFSQTDLEGRERNAERPECRTVGDLTIKLKFRSV